MSATLGIVIEARSRACGAWQPVPVDGLLAHRQFGRLAIGSTATECPVYTLAAPSAMLELLRGGWGAEKTCIPLQEGVGLPVDASAACTRDVEALADPERGSLGWFTSARLQNYPWAAGRREPLEDESWLQEPFDPALMREASHLEAILLGLGAPADVRVIMFLV